MTEYYPYVPYYPNVVKATLSPTDTFFTESLIYIFYIKYCIFTITPAPSIPVTAGNTLLLGYSP